MTLSFSTLGCPKLSFRDVLSLAKELGYNGIELRGIMQTIDAPDLKEFSEENYKATLERLEQLGLEIPILTSACKLYREEKWDATLKLAKRYVDMAKRIAIPRRAAMCRMKLCWNTWGRLQNMLRSRAL